MSSQDRKRLSTILKARWMLSALTITVTQARPITTSI
jgi:hypothetical protein